jgi:acetoin utilization deacetylase AcuC-like enzyme
LVSAGFDGHHSDPVGSLSLSTPCYGKVYETIANLAPRICNGKLVSVLEGGYSLKIVGKMAASAIAKMSGSSYAVNERVPAFKRSVRVEAEKVLREVKKVQRNFWNID